MNQLKQVKTYKLNTIWLFTAISFAGVIGFLVVSEFVWHDMFYWLCMDHTSHWEFGDFFRIMNWSAGTLKNVYQYPNDLVDLPALPIVLMKAVWRINEIPYDSTDWTDLKTTNFELLIFLMFMTITTLLFVAVISLVLKYDTIHTLLIAGSLICSLPFFAGGFERGNISYAIMVTLAFALVFRESDKWQLRELALLLIALCAGMKMYPAVFGLFYLKDKRFKEAGRLVVYGVLMFILPFFLTDGIQAWLNNLAGRYETPTVRWISICGFVNYWLTTTGHEAMIELGIGKILSYIFLLFMIVMTLIARKKWKTILYPCLMIIFFPELGFRYQMMFLAIPMMFFFAEMAQKGEKTRMDIVYTVMFGLIFTVPIWWWFGEAEHWMCAVAYIFSIVAVVEDIRDFVKGRKAEAAFS